MAKKEPTQARSVSRRTLAKGAAWSVPVVASAAAAPMAAASPATSISGTPPAATGVCSPIGSFEITVTNNGAPAPGQTVLVTLPDGFSWPSNASNPQTFVTTADGTVTITGVTGPATPGTYNVTATVGSGSTAATATIPIMVQGSWGVISAGPNGAPAHGIYTNPTDVNNLGTATCLAYCIEHNQSGPDGEVVLVGGVDSFLGNNNFNGGVSTTNYVAPGGSSNATLTAAQVQAKIQWILLHSYPTVSLSALAAATGQSGLQEDDVIEATQYAIWSYSDLNYIDDNWPFADGTPSDRTPRWLQEQAVFDYLVNGAWTDTATAPSSCMKVVSSTTSKCSVPTSADHLQSLVMVCDCA